MRFPPVVRARRGALSVALALALAAGLAGCRDGAVRLTFRPEAGTTYHYEVEVRTVSEVQMSGQEPEVRQEDVVLMAEHTVLRSSPEGVEVRVLLQEPGGPERVFEVIFDRAAQLEEVQSIEGVPDDRLGTLGIAEIFPAAAGAPPDQPLVPGSSWIIDDVIQLPDGGAAATKLTGSGRLVELAVVGGEKVARLASAARLPLESVATPGGNLRLSGSQVTDYAATHDLDDGAVREATSNTVGNFDLEIGPPPNVGAEPVTGTLRVEVSSRTRLIE